MMFVSSVRATATSPYIFLANIKERSIEAGLSAIATLVTPAPETVWVSGKHIEELISYQM